MNAEEIHKVCILKYRRHLMNTDELFAPKCLMTIKSVTVAYLMSANLSGALRRVRKLSLLKTL